MTSRTFNTFPIAFPDGCPSQHGADPLANPRLARIDDIVEAIVTAREAIEDLGLRGFTVETLDLPKRGKPVVRVRHTRHVAALPCRLHHLSEGPDGMNEIYRADYQGVIVEWAALSPRNHWARG